MKKKLVFFSALPFEVWALCLDLTFLHLISSLFFTCLRVLIPSSSLLVDFFSHCIIISLFCFNNTIAQSLSCASDVCHFVIRSALFCFVLMYARFVNFFSTTSCTDMYFSITHASFFKVLSWMPMLLQIDYRHGS